MAKKEDKKEKKTVLERAYNIPLRKKYQRAPRWKRTNRAVKAVRQFVMKHMKAKEVKIGKYLNLELWKHGAKNPPHHIRANCRKDEEDIVTAELVGAPEEKTKEEPKKKEKEEEVEIKVKEALGAEDEKIEEFEKKEKEIKKDKAEEAKEIEEEEIKELKKEHPKTHHPQKQDLKQRKVEVHKTAHTNK